MSLALLGASLWASFAWAATYVVPDDHSTIQAAIDSSASGDTILVRAGTYFENLQTLGKSLTLKSLGGPQSTIIDGNQLGSVITVTGDIRIEGFTIRNGLSQNGGGIRIEGQASDFATVEIIKNTITENRAGYIVDEGNGGGIYFEYGTASVIGENTFSQNYAGDSGGGAYLSAALNCQIRNNKFMDNGCHVGGGGLHAGVDEITENLFLRNWSDSFGGGVDGGASLIKGNTIIFNYINNGAFPQGAGLHVFGGPQVIEQNIVVLNHGPRGDTGVGIKCGSDYGAITIRCNDVWGNDIDYQILVGCDTAGLGNISADPKFCDVQGGNFTLDSASPCSEENSSGCGLIGAFGVACISPTRTITWGQIKSRYVSHE